MTTSNHLFSFRDVGILLYLLPFRMIAAVLPRKVIQFIGLLIGHICSRLGYGRKRGIQRRLRTALGNFRTNDEIIELSRRCILNGVTSHVDALILKRMGTQALLRNGKVGGVEHLNNALLREKGVLLVTGHFTGNKIAFRFLYESGYPFLEISKRHVDDPRVSWLENRYLRPYWSKVISDRGQGSVFVEDKDVGLRIIHQLRENGIVLIFLDVPFSQHLLRRPFLGSDREFPIDFLRVVCATGAAIVPMVATGNSSAFNVCFEEAIIPLEAASKDEFIAKNIDILVKVLESQVLREPSHWFLI